MYKIKPLVWYDLNEYKYASVPGFEYYVRKLGTGLWSVLINIDTKGEYTREFETEKEAVDFCEKDWICEIEDYLEKIE